MGDSALWYSHFSPSFSLFLSPLFTTGVRVGWGVLLLQSLAAAAVGAVVAESSSGQLCLSTHPI